MYFDFDDHRPETPRVPTALSVREGILLSIVVHLSFVIVVLLFPDVLSPDESVEVQARLEEQARQDRPPLRFVEVMPLLDRSERPVRPADESDMDRRSRSRERPPVTDNSNPFMRGNSPEMAEGGPTAPPASPPPSPPAPEAGMIPAPNQPERPDSAATAALPSPPSPSAQQRLAENLRNPGRYLSNDQFDNQTGGDTDSSFDVQFDTMGTDFGQWWPRVKRQIQGNWLIPTAAGFIRGRTVIRFTVHRDGFISDIVVLQPAPAPSLTSAAVNALKLSNPTVRLPPGYPADRMPITVTFCYYARDPRECR